MTEEIADLEAAKCKYVSLQQERDGQDEHIRKLQNEVFKLRSQVQHQSSYCASLGSIMGNLMWKVCRVPDVVKTLYTEDRFPKFCSIVTDIFVSFMETYGPKFPDKKTDQMQFVLSLAGTVANIAASPEGRQFLATDEKGKELLGKIIDIFPYIPAVTGDAFKNLILMALYNLSINQNGLMMLQDQEELLTTLNLNITDNPTPELKLMSLRLLQALTYEVPNVYVFLKILQQIPLKTVQELSKTDDAEMRIIAQNILSNLEKIQKYQLCMYQSPENVRFEDCQMVQNTFIQKWYKSSGLKEVSKQSENEQK